MVGVPLITQVEALMLKPAGSAGELVQLVIEVAFELRVVGVTVMEAFVNPVVPVAPE